MLPRLYEKKLLELSAQVCMDMDADFSSEIRSFADMLRSKEHQYERSIVEVAFQSLYDGDTASLERDFRNLKTSRGSVFSHSQRMQVLRAVYGPLRRIYGASLGLALDAGADCPNVQKSYEELLSDFVEDIRMNADDAASDIQYVMKQIFLSHRRGKERVLKTLLQSLCEGDPPLRTYLCKLDVLGTEELFETMKVEPSQRAELLPCLCEALSPYI